MTENSNTAQHHPEAELQAEARGRMGNYPLLRPKDASTLILIDRSGSEPALLMGKRHTAHAFMPDTYVFPGGRRDRDDGRVPVADRLQPAVEEKLLKKMANPASAHRAQALAIAAVRETHEEVGIFIAGPGQASRQDAWRAFAERKIAPRLSPLRYIARAITPPRQKRRFDTRFFACFRDEIGEVEAESSNELLDLKWVKLSEAGGVNMPRITQAIITDLAYELENDPSLPFGRPVPFYQARYGRFTREVL
ncbi:hydrolase [Hoeflea sp. TYP-13]|uniref:NUDIX hydrolase n=1 Tax=Hoeflea sp. TYP-13 TaxID=3230023 RepID=UPI0034C5D0F5